MALRENAPVYEDFQPTYDWADEEETIILYIYVPGFEREQLKIMYVHSSRIIRVDGEKSLGNNRRIRFNQSFPVPENCDVTKIQAKFQHGILTITLPKLVIPTQYPKQEVKTTPQEPRKAPQAPPAMPKVPEAPLAAPKQEVKPTPREAARDPIAPKQDVTPAPQKAAIVPPKARIPGDTQKPEKVQEALPPKASLADALKAKVDKDVVSSRSPKMATSDHAKLQKEQPLEAPQDPALGTNTGRIVEEKEKDQVSGEATLGKKPEKGIEKSDFKENGVSKKGKDSAVENAFQKVSDKQKPSVVAQEKSKREELVATSINGIRRYAAGTKQAAQSFAKMLAQEDENKQLMLNVGAAAVVIMALGAYISYSFLTKGKDDK